MRCQVHNLTTYLNVSNNGDSTFNVIPLTVGDKIRISSILAP